MKDEGASRSSRSLRPRPAFLESRVWVADVAMAVRDWCVDERHFGH